MGGGDFLKTDFNAITNELNSNNFNLLLKGNNYCALNSLKARFSNSVKLIYIDPPYNTGNDSFNYNDRFNHSSWLVFMKNRLEIARELLRDDGVIFIQCDDNEQAYLKVLCDEIFGRENFVSCIAVLSSTPSGVKTTHRDKTIIKTKDYILVYAKNSRNLKLKSQYKEVKKWDTHFNFYFDKENNKVISLKEVLEQMNICKNIKDYSLNNKEFAKFIYDNADKIFQTGKNMPESIRAISLLPENKNKPIQYESQDDIQYAYNGRRMSFLSKSIHKVMSNNKIENKIANLLCDFWDDIDFNNTQNQGEFSFVSGKKPEQLIYRIIDMTTNENDLILDFFAGSGTTLAVAHKMNRRYIGIEQMDYVESITKERLKKVIAGESGGVSKALNFQGGGSFIYAELLALNALYKEKIKNADSKNILEIFDEVRQKAFLDYRADFEKDFGDFENLNLEAQKELLTMALDSNMDYLPLGEIKDSEYDIDENTIKLNEIFYKRD